jgi:hypothetical protein
MMRAKFFICRPVAKRSSPAEARKRAGNSPEFPLPREGACL